MFLKRSFVRLGWVVGFCLALLLGFPFIGNVIVGDLVHSPLPVVGQVLVIENLESTYLLFEAAETLRREGRADRIVVPVFTDGGDRPGEVSLGIVRVMIEVSRIPEFETVPVVEREPISLNVARQVGDYLGNSPISSVLVVTDGFRSERTYEIYRRVFEGRGISVEVHPVFGSRDPSNWTESWHGVQEVGLQFLKLWYYRLFVLWRVEPLGAG